MPPISHPRLPWHQAPMCLPDPRALLTGLCLPDAHIFFRCGSFLKMPVASRTEISLLFRRLGWVAWQRAQEMAAKGLAQTKP